MLPELEDQPWFPDLLRRQQTEFIGWMVQAFGVYRRIPPILVKAAAAHDGVVTDLGSGSGGPLLSLARHPDLAQMSFLLTDKFPQPIAGLPPNCILHRPSLDARDPLPAATGLVTMFNAFHHLSQPERLELLKKLMLNGRSFMAAEILAPGPVHAFRILLATTIGQVLLAPLVKPFSLKRLLLTWVLPVNLFTVTWDGLASVLRGISDKDWEELAAFARNMGASTHIIRTGSIITPVTVFWCEPPGQKHYF